MHIHHLPHTMSPLVTRTMEKDTNSSDAIPRMVTVVLTTHRRSQGDALDANLQPSTSQTTRGSRLTKIPFSVLLFASVTIVAILQTASILPAEFSTSFVDHQRTEPVFNQQGTSKPLATDLLLSPTTTTTITTTTGGERQRSTRPSRQFDLTRKLEATDETMIGE